MKTEEVLDRLLRAGDTESAFRWVMERLVWEPDSLVLKAMASFVFAVNGQGWGAGRELAESTLKEDPDQSWALAALMGTYALDRIERTPWFFDEEVFKLGPQWYERLKWVGNHAEARKLLYLQARYGPASRKAEISERLTVSGYTPGCSGGDGAAGDPFCAVGK